MRLATGTAADVEVLRNQFERQHYVRLPRFLKPALLARVLARIGEDDLQSHEDVGIAREARAMAGPAFNLLMFAINHPEVFDLISRITDRAHIKVFNGRLYRFDPAAGHGDSWHDDLGDARLVAMSINLSSEPYEGGALQIRDSRSLEILQEVANPFAGDAVIFRIDTTLQHRVTPIVGAAPRTAFAGWFQSSPNAFSVLGLR